MVVFRRVVMARGACPVRAWERSSSKVRLRHQCSLFLDAAPVALDRGGQGDWRGGGVVGGGDQVHDLDALLLGLGDGAVDLGDLSGAGEADPRRLSRSPLNFGGGPGDRQAAITGSS